MTDAQPPDALQVKLLSIVREFKGLNGISTVRLAREAKKEVDLVQRTLMALEVGGMVRPRTMDNLLFWMITAKGEQVLNGQAPETIEVIPEPAPPEASALSDASVPEQDDADEAWNTDMPAAAPDEPKIWYVCDHVDKDGIKCGRRFASQHALVVHSAMAHGDKAKEAHAPEKPRRRTGRPSVVDSAAIDKQIVELYPTCTVTMLVKRLGLRRKVVEAKIYKLIKQGRLNYKLPRRPKPSVPTKDEAISKDSPTGTPEKSDSNPFSGLAKLLAELNAIPGVKVSISISLGVN